MIRSFKHSQLEALHTSGKRGNRIPAELAKALLKKLDVIHEASTERELSNNATRYKKLDLTRNFFSSIWVNSKHRLLFRWDDGAHDVHLTAHDYKSSDALMLMP